MNNKMKKVAERLVFQLQPTTLDSFCPLGSVSASDSLPFSQKPDCDSNEVEKPESPQTAATDRPHTSPDVADFPTSSQDITPLAPPPQNQHLPEMLVFV